MVYDTFFSTNRRAARHWHAYVLHICCCLIFHAVKVTATAALMAGAPDFKILDGAGHRWKPKIQWGRAVNSTWAFQVSVKNGPCAALALIRVRHHVN